MTVVFKISYNFRRNRDFNDFGNCLDDSNYMTTMGRTKGELLLGNG